MQQKIACVNSNIEYCTTLAKIIQRCEIILKSKINIIQAQFFLPSVDGDLTEGKPPINVKFEIPYFTTSGIQVQKDFDTLPISVNICSR